MINPRYVEIGLFRWTDYLESLFSFRRETGYERAISDADNLQVTNAELKILCEEARRKLIDLDLRRMDDPMFTPLEVAFRPTTIDYDLPVVEMLTYFLCCAFRLDICWDRKNGVDTKKIVRPIWLGGDGTKVFPKALFTPSDLIIKYYGGGLRIDHPLFKLTRIRRKFKYGDFLGAIENECALLADMHLTIVEIGQRFGWSIQEDPYEILAPQCRTAARAISRGREARYGEKVLRKRT